MTGSIKGSDSDYIPHSTKPAPPDRLKAFGLTQEEVDQLQEEVEELEDEEDSEEDEEY